MRSRCPKTHCSQDRRAGHPLPLLRLSQSRSAGHPLPLPRLSQNRLAEHLHRHLRMSQTQSAEHPHWQSRLSQNRSAEYPHRQLRMSQTLPVLKPVPLRYLSSRLPARRYFRQPDLPPILLQNQARCPPVSSLSYTSSKLPMRLSFQDGFLFVSSFSSPSYKSLSLINRHNNLIYTLYQTEKEIQTFGIKVIILGYYPGNAAFRFYSDCYLSPGKSFHPRYIDFFYKTDYSMISIS